VNGAEIRVADPAGPEASALVADFFAEIESRYPGFDASRQPPAPLDGFTTSNGGVFLVATLDDEPVGCAGLQRLDPSTGEVRRMYVREAARGRGIARALLATLVETARDHGYERLRLDTGDRLPEAQALYRSAGFREIDDYNGNPFAAYWMELSLDTPTSLPASEAGSR
jgi:GNAT superfamily N-acetyltransferase